MKKPNRDELNATPRYFTELVQRIGLSQTDLADRVGIAKRRIQYLGQGERVSSDPRGSKHVEPVRMSYPEQYTLEALAGVHDDNWTISAESALRLVENHLIHHQDASPSNELLQMVHIVLATKP